MHHSNPTYAELRQRYGKGTIVHDPKPVVMTARLQIASPAPQAVADRTQMASARTTAQGELMRIAFVLTVSGANLNNQVFLESDLMLPDVYRSPIGQPIDLDHDQTFHAVCGEIITAEYFPATSGMNSGIRCEGTIFSDLYPHVAAKILRGVGRWAAISMEALPNPLEELGKFLVVHNPRFIGCALVRMPGCPDAQIHEIDGKPVGAGADPRAQVSLLRNSLTMLDSTF